MPRLLTEEFVRNRVLEWLARQGYSATHVKTLSEHGPDIKAKRIGSNCFYVIECKGDAPANPQKMRYPNLVSALGEIVQRITKAKYCRYAIALPASYSELVKRRIPAIAAKRLDLEALLVDGSGKIERLAWKEFAGRPNPGGRL